MVLVERGGRALFFGSGQSQLLKQITTTALFLATMATSAIFGLLASSAFFYAHLRFGHFTRPRSTSTTQAPRHIYILFQLITGARFFQRGIYYRKRLRAYM